MGLEVAGLGFKTLLCPLPEALVKSLISEWHSLYLQSGNSEMISTSKGDEYQVRSSNPLMSWKYTSVLLIAILMKTLRVWEAP